MFIKKAIALLLILIFSTTVVYAEVPPRNDVEGTVIESDINNMDIWLHDSQLLLVNGIHNQGERFIRTFDKGVYDNDLFGLYKFKTIKKYTVPKDDWSILFTAMTNGSILMNSLAHIHATHKDLEDSYELIDQSTENGCQSFNKIYTIRIDMSKLSDEDSENINIDIPVTESEIDEWISAKSSEFNSVIYSKYTINNNRLYLLSMYNENNNNDNEYINSLQSLAIQFTPNGNILMIALE